MITLENMDQQRCIDWIETQYEGQIIKKSFEEYRNDDGTLAYREGRYYLKGAIILHLHSDSFLDLVYSHSKPASIVSVLSAELSRFKSARD